EPPEAASRAGSPVTSAATQKTSDPAAISYTDATSALRGSGSRCEKNEPDDQDTAATSSSAAPAGRSTPPPPPREATSAASPVKPTATPASVAARGRSPV